MPVSKQQDVVQRFTQTGVKKVRVPVLERAPILGSLVVITTIVIVVFVVVALIALSLQRFRCGHPIPLTGNLVSDDWLAPWGSSGLGAGFRVQGSVGS